MRRAGLALGVVVVAVVGCESESRENREPLERSMEHPGRPSPRDLMTGSVVVGGQAAELTACKPGHAARVFVEVVTSRGKLRFEDMRLYWNPDAAARDRGAAVDCAQLDRSWGGGTRQDGSAYWRGTLAFACTYDGKPLVGNLMLDCGMITPEERASLDQNRMEMRAEQAHGRGE